MYTHPCQNQLYFQGIADRNSIAEYTVTVYYTSTFRKFTADPETFIEQVQYIYYNIVLIFNFI